MTDTITISKADLKAIVKEAVREEFHDVGLRTDEPEHVDEAREDFRFIRRVRKAMDTTASKIGTAIILALVGGLITLITLGFRAFSLK
ncbi:hypothetical protein [Chelatococcus asaccharovorans]|uniref:hypothetical protein n=1 Tax=Chelatococcus asaccharovorans TaxID=28210 RepID=UPI00224C6551|nr:hypothetical protein [Chelatococcus asaccharovorans]CAH1672254.1 conserved hypothetical protein [Chelatococcus asaccharovorans]CAH1676332.1 conserved hypothetical protein [Chelatococcus asaccharovorans]